MAMNVGTPLHSDEPELLMDINTTPLIDVMLVLLIMLIITIPMQLHSVNLDMPTTANSAPQAPPVVIKIQLDADGTIHWNGQVVASQQDLQARFQDSAQRTPQPEIHIRSHGQAKYEVAASVLAGAQRAGLKKLGIVGTEQFAD